MQKIELINEPDFARASEVALYAWIKQLVMAHNELVDEIEGLKGKPKTISVDTTECQHLNTHPFGRNGQLKRCRDCKKIFK